MSGKTTDAEPRLRQNSRGLPELVFHAVTHIAPVTSVVFIFPAIAHQAGPIIRVGSSRAGEVESLESALTQEEGYAVLERES